MRGDPDQLGVGEGFRGPTGHVGYLLRQAQTAFNDAMAARLEPHGLTPRQYAVLTVLIASGPLSVSELARRSLVATQSMHEIVGHLIAADLVGRHAHPTHGRVRLLAPTARGRRLVERARPVVDALEDRCLASLRDQDRRTVLRWLVDTAAAAQADGDPTDPSR